jgi:hypothetical protein
MAVYLLGLHKLGIHEIGETMRESNNEKKKKSRGRRQGSEMKRVNGCAFGTCHNSKNVRKACLPAILVKGQGYVNVTGVRWDWVG